MAAALLMSIWVAILARLDLRGDPSKAVALCCGNDSDLQHGPRYYFVCALSFCFWIHASFGLGVAAEEKNGAECFRIRQRRRTFPAR